MGVIESQQHKPVNTFLHHVYLRHGTAKEPRRSPTCAARTAPRAALNPPHACAVGQDRRAWAGVASCAHRPCPYSTSRLTPAQTDCLRRGLNWAVRPHTKQSGRQPFALLRRGSRLQKCIHPSTSACPRSKGTCSHPQAMPASAQYCLQPPLLRCPGRASSSILGLSASFCFVYTGPNPALQRTAASSAALNYPAGRR
jgi:hypothetical protein